MKSDQSSLIGGCVPDCRRTGSILVLWAIVLTAIFAIAVLAVDLANLQMAQAELQISASSAAAAAALELPDEDAAATVAVQLAESNMPPAIHGDVLVADDVIMGGWDEDTRTFTAGLAPANAVSVTTRRSTSNGNPVGSIFATMFGHSEHELAASATAVVLPTLLGAVGSVGSVTFTGNVFVDSYESTEGPYDPMTANSNGDVTSGGTVSVGGGVMINGDVSGSEVDSSGGATVTGETSTSRRSLDYPAVDTSEIALNNDNDTLPLYQQGNNMVSPLDGDRNFILSGGVTYDLPAGNYYFNDLGLQGQSTLTIAGPTTIYLTGDLSTAGGQLINSTADPKQLIIFMTNGTATINASIDWFAMLYAPNTEVNLSGSSDFFGAVVGGSVTASGSGDLHFDEDLNDVIDDFIDLPNRSTIVQ